MSSEHLAKAILKQAHPTVVAETIYREKVQLRPLRLRPTSPDPTKRNRSKRHHESIRQKSGQKRARKPRPLSAKQKRALCIYDVPKDQRNYSRYEPLHAMWCEYMREILNFAPDKGETAHVEATAHGHILVTADYHGAIIRIVRSRCVSRVGLQGIVIKDTKFTFEIITRTNELKTVPKEHTTFQFQVPATGADHGKPLVFEIYGDQFATRAPDRASRKFRWHANPDL